MAQEVYTTIPSRGVEVIKALNHGLIQFKDILFIAEVSENEQQEHCETLFDLMVNIASLCSCSDSWERTYHLLQEAGVVVPQEYCDDMMYLDKLSGKKLSKPTIFDE